MPEKKRVFMCMSTDVVHGGHIEIINQAAELGELTVGVLTDEVVSAYKRYPLLSCEERMKIVAGLKGVAHVIKQTDISYREPLKTLRPDYVVHGDDWRIGFQKPVREECIRLLEEYGGKLVEFPYSRSEQYDQLESAARSQLSIPDIRRGRLRRLIEQKGMAVCMEAHTGLTGLIAEKTTVMEQGTIRQFDGMWISSLCDSTIKGKPDTELVDFSSRLNTINDIMEVTTKPIILDGDTGGLTEHFVYMVRSLERLGVSAVIIEDKTGLKKNSLFGTEVAQEQDSMENFCHKIAEGKRAQKTKDFMLIARIESLILEKGMEDALARARAYAAAGADGVMIHSRRKDPDEVFEFIRRFRTENRHTLLVVVPTSYNSVYEEEFKERGVNVVIYANHLIRSSYPAMCQTAESILRCHRAKEADEQYCMSIKNILTLIPEE
ncbi:phosphoenolpyruvate mutase [Oscillospiraceae bacterium 50-16]